MTIQLVGTVVAPKDPSSWDDPVHGPQTAISASLQQAIHKADDYKPWIEARNHMVEPLKAAAKAGSPVSLTCREQAIVTKAGKRFVKFLVLSIDPLA